MMEYEPQRSAFYWGLRTLWVILAIVIVAVVVWLWLGPILWGPAFTPHVGRGPVHIPRPVVPSTR